MPPPSPKCLKTQERRRPFRTLRLPVLPDPFRDPVREGASVLGASDRPVPADRHDTEVIATVLLPAGFVVLGANRALLAIAHEVEAICRNSTLDQVPLGRRCTALAKGQVVLVRSTLVSIAFDANPHTRVGLEPWNLTIECSCCIRSDRRLVEVEVDRSRDLRGVDRYQRRHAARIARQDA